VGIGRIFSRGETVDFLRHAKRIFSGGGQQWQNLILLTPKLREKRFSTKKLLADYQISKSRQSITPDAHGGISGILNGNWWGA